MRNRFEIFANLKQHIHSRIGMTKKLFDQVSHVIAFIFILLITSPTTAQLEPDSESDLIQEADVIQNEEIAQPVLVSGEFRSETVWNRILSGDFSDIVGGISWLWDKSFDLWNFELFNAGDSSIKINQLIIALLWLLLGLFFAKRVASFVEQRILAIPRVHVSAAYLIRKIVYYFIIVIACLLALSLAGIPMTVFTVLGGALAIGVGFGAQNLFNNLISGLILMLERPIRIGDILKLDDTEMRVMEIGNRVTKLRRSDGIDVLVPNSDFVESHIVNWTLSDHDIRGSVTVGVAYGSPTREVETLLLQAVDEQPKANKTPQPIVLFTEFGDSALNFEVLFWTSVQRPMDVRQLQSDIRFRIDELCREKNIAIAFPQTDIHLDTSRPVEIKMVNTD